jgi:monothiol glutaredoxin
MDTALPPELYSKIDTLVKTTPVVLFMKGTAAQPMCGFSARAAGMLQHLNVPFADVNVLQDDELREGIKVYSNWPTIPQLYINGTFMGGCDIMTEMFQAGELHSALGLSVPSAA